MRRINAQGRKKERKNPGMKNKIVLENSILL